MSNRHVHPLFDGLFGAWFPQEVTDFREDSVRILQTDFYKLPYDVQRLIETYASGAVMQIDGPYFVVTMPVYRTKEVADAIAKHLPWPTEDQPR